MKNADNLDTAEIPSSPPRFIRMDDVVNIVGTSRADVYRRMRAGQFPAATKLSERVAVWLESDIHAWVLEHARKRPARPVG